MVVLYFIPLIILLLIPRELLYRYFEFIKVKLTRETLLSRGESLLFWLDSFGLDGVGYDLGGALPAQNLYKSFGHYIHEAWLQVQQRGGELNPYFRVIKSLLRVDLKRETKESESINLMRFQIVAILTLVWVFLLSLRFVIGDGLGVHGLALIALWQFLGIVIGFIIISKLKKRYFNPISELLELLLKLHSLRFSGNITQSGLGCDLSGNDLQAGLIVKRMEGLVNRWRLKGCGDFSALDDLLEDIIALSQHRSEKFLKVGPFFFFIWCCAFVLPVLFGASVFGLAGQLNV